MTQDSIVYVIGTGIVTALSTVVGVLWNRQVKNEETTRKDLEECRSDRERLWAKIETLQTEIGKFLRGA
jgi:hypothetical protein